MKPVALILGGAKCLAADRAAAALLFDPETIVATNHAGKDEPVSVPHWASMHPELFPLWKAERRRAGLPDFTGDLWCAIGRPIPKGYVCRRVPSWGGSSGLLAVLVAFELGYDRVVLAGVPLDASPHYDDPKAWRDGPRYHYAWTKRLPELKGRVRSMSGWTSTLLGTPDAAWLEC